MKAKNLFIFSVLSAVQALSMDPSLNQAQLLKAASSWDVSVGELLSSFAGHEQELRALLATFREEPPQIPAAPVVDNQFNADMELALSMMQEDDEAFGRGMGQEKPHDGELLSMSKIHNIDIETLKFLKENAHDEFNELRKSALPAQPEPVIEAIKAIEDSEELTTNFWYTLFLDDKENIQHKIIYDEGVKVNKYVRLNQSTLREDPRKSFDNIWSFNCEPNKHSHILHLHDCMREYNFGKNEQRKRVSKMVANGAMSVEQGIRLLDYFGGPGWIAYRMMSIAPKRSIIEIMELFPKEYNVIPGEAAEIFRRSFNLKYGFSKGSFADGIVPPAMRVQLELKKILAGDYKDLVLSEQLVDRIYESLQGIKFTFSGEFAQHPRELNKIEIKDIIVFTKNDGFTLKPWDQVISQGLLDSKIGARPIPAPLVIDPELSWKVAARNFIRENGEGNLNFFYDAFSDIYGCGADADNNSPGKFIEGILLYNDQVKELSNAGLSVKELILQIVSLKTFVIKETERCLTNDEVSTIVDYILYNEF